MSALPKTIATFAKNKRETVHVTLSEYKGTNLVDLRVYAPKGEEGVTVPTPKGIACNVSMLPALRAALADAEAEAVRLGLLDLEGGAHG